MQGRRCRERAGRAPRGWAMRTGPSAGDPLPTAQESSQGQGDGGQGESSPGAPPQPFPVLDEPEAERGQRVPTSRARTCSWLFPETPSSTSCSRQRTLPRGLLSTRIPPPSLQDPGYHQTGKPVASEVPGGAPGSSPASGRASRALPEWGVRGHGVRGRVGWGAVPQRARAEPRGLLHPRHPKRPPAPGPRRRLAPAAYAPGLAPPQREAGGSPGGRCAAGGGREGRCGGRG